MERISPSFFVLALILSLVRPTAGFGQGGNCEPPFLLSVSNITPNSVTLNWTPLGTETEWEVAVVPQGSPLPGIPTLSGITSHPVVHPGLNSGTAYDFYVRAVCDTLPGDWAKYNSFFITGLTNPSPCRMGLNIPDEQCRTFNIWVDGAPGTEMGADVFLQEVHLILRHQWADDVELTLISPDGVEVDLSSDNGGNDDHYGNPNDPTCSEFTRFVNILTEGACDQLSITEGEAPFIGSFLPEEPLTAFHTGVDPNGIWKLRVCDDAGDDTGRLEFVELVFSPLICAAPVTLVVESVDSTFAGLSWMPGDSCQGTLIEYGLPGFTPGADGNPGAGGTVVMASCPPFILTGLAPETTYEIYIREACPEGGYTANSCPVQFTTLCSPLPISQWEDFNSEAICTGICSSTCDLLGLWQNSRADDLDWLALEGETETPGTGPSDDFPGGGRYVYLEGSGACSFGSEAVLYSHCMQIVAPPGSSCHFSFDYHMYGTAVHSLELDISTDGGITWEPLWSLSGNQGDQWFRQFVDLSTYDGFSAQLRFVGKKGNNVRSDMALDNLIFYGSVDLGAPAYIYYEDIDGDGYGNDEVFFASCEPIAPPGYAALGGDCFDLFPDINPGQEETPCDGFDINCNGDDDEWILPPPATASDTVCAGQFGAVTATPGFGGIIIWYDVPEGGEPLDTSVFYLPDPPLEQDGSAPVTYTFYAEEINLLGCVNVERSPASITVLPQPNLFIPPGQLEPVCAGDTIDLSALIIQQLNNSQATLTFHSAFPPGPANVIDPPLVNPLSATTYYVLATGAGGCTDTDSILVEVKDSPIAHIAGNPELCRGASQVLQVEDLGNGIPPLDYVWSNASNATSVFVLGNHPVGTVLTYSVTITDAGGCRSSDSFDVEIVGSINAVLVGGQDVSTCGGSNGAIQLSISGGVAPFYISWEGPVSGTDTSAVSVYAITGLPQGTYSITVTDSSPTACPFVVPIAIINGPQAQVEIASVQPVSCFGAMDGCIELQVSGVNPVITWSTGDTDSTVLCGLPGGLYSVTVTDGACENVINDIILQEPDSLTGKTAFIQNVSCNGAMDGWIAIVLGGGTPPYQFDWSNGETTQNLNNLGAGSYTLTITDARGCQLVLGPNEIEEPPALDVSILKTPVVCTDGVGGALEAQVSGGVGPYGYLWSTGSNLPFIEDLGPGQYDLTVTDVTGCSVVLSIELDNPAPLEVNLILNDPPTCFGVADGQLELQASGGQPPYTYDWSTGDSGPLVTLPAGTYEVTVMDATGCTVKVDSIVLIAPNPVSVLSSITPASCLGISDGQIQLLPQNGQQPFSYAWEGGATGPLLTNLPAGNYTCTITDANGCETVEEFTLPFDQPISANVTPLGPNCSDGGNGKIFLTVMGGNPFYSYAWSSGQQTKDLLDVPAGAYVCTITDMDGCQLILDTVILQNPDPIVIELLALDSISCNGSADGQIDMGVSGGVPPYIFTWNTEATTEDLDQVEGGIYVLTVEDALNCAVNSQPVVLPEPAPLVLSTEAIDNIINCQSNTIDTLLVEIQGGSAPYQIQWSTGQTEPYVLGTVPGDYSVTVTDAQGCVDSLTSLKVPEPVPFLSLGISTNFAFSGDCENPASTATLKVNINGGQAPFQYNWSVGIQGTTSSHTLTLGNLMEDAYSVTVTDAFGCVAVSNVVQVVFPNPLNVVVTGASIGDVSCNSGADGFVHPIVNGGAEPYQFLWTDTQGMPVGLEQNLDSIPAGSYILQVIDQNGCLVEIPDIEVDEPQEALTLSVEKEDILCFGNDDGAITAFPTGGTPLYTYTWSVPGTQAFLENLPAGLYFLTVEDANGCSALIDSIEILQPASALQLDTAIVSPILCNGAKDGAIDIEVSGGSPPYDYIWSNGKLTEDIAGLGQGNYKCTIVDANGCQLVTPVYPLTNPPALVVTAFVIDTATINLADGALTVQAGGGVMPYSYVWSNGDTTAMADSLAAGNYTVTITDANGCILEAQVYLPFKVINSVWEAGGVSWSLYPNPAGGTAWLDIPGGLGEGGAIRLWDPLGRLARSILPLEPDHPLQILDLQGIPPGLYRVELLSGAGWLGEAWLIIAE